MPPGPKMGPRPLDFDEEMIKQSPTFVKWQSLEEGEKLRYACREFVKGMPDEEERLMRRIMIARRNNIRDHETVKEARRRVITTTTSTTVASETPNTAITATKSLEVLLTNTNTEATVAAAIVASVAASNKVDALVKTESEATTTTSHRKNSNKRKSPATFTDAQIEQEMDKQAVEATRSYKAWLALPDGAEFVYNQKYIKGQPDHDWALRKNIWRRMRYRRENKKMVQDYKQKIVTSSIPRSLPPSIAITTNANQLSTPTAKKVVTDSANTNIIASNTMTNHEESSLLSADRDAVEAAVAAAQNFPAVDPAVAVAASLAAANPLMESPVAQAALDAAAQLAAAQVKVEEEDDDEDEGEEQVQDDNEHISEKVY